MIYATPPPADTTNMVAPVSTQHQQPQPQNQALQPGEPDVSPPVNRRRSTRFPTATVGKLTSQSDAPEIYEIFVTDVSLHGAGFKCTKPLPGDQRYRIEIGTGPLHLTGTIRLVSCRPRRDGTYDAGGEFV